jgi:GTP pyrophosphokinase
MSGRTTMPLSDRFEKALVYATRAHAQQTRKQTTIPYVAHLLGVAGIALTHGADEDEAIAALLHDAVEDQGGATTRDEIRAQFGERVAEIVDGCSDTDVEPKPEWRERKEAYLEHLRTASPSVRLVSAADKVDNARAILADYRVLGEKLWERFTGGRAGTLWYYRTLVDRFHQHGETPLVATLREVVEEIERSVAANDPALAPGKALFAKDGPD